MAIHGQSLLINGWSEIIRFIECFNRIEKRCWGMGLAIEGATAAMKYGVGNLEFQRVR